jgi:hypothetical protein
MSKKSSAKKEVNEFKILFIILFVLICGSLFFSIYGIYLQNNKCDSQKCETNIKDNKDSKKCEEDVFEHSVLVMFNEKKVYNVLFDYNVLNEINTDIQNVSLGFLGNYVLKLENGEEIIFDEFESYIYYNGKIAVMNKVVWNDLKKVFPIDNQGCCSCCPDLKPGEACIEMCCPCSDN